MTLVTDGGAAFDNITINVAPEPATIALLAMGRPAFLWKVKIAKAWRESDMIKWRG